jgi:hypothetical protein
MPGIVSATVVGAVVGAEFRLLKTPIPKGLVCIRDSALVSAGCGYRAPSAAAGRAPGYARGAPLPGEFQGTEAGGASSGSVIVHPLRPVMAAPLFKNPMRPLALFGRL